MVDDGVSYFFRVRQMSQLEPSLPPILLLSRAARIQGQTPLGSAAADKLLGWSDPFCGSGVNWPLRNPRTHAVVF